MESFSSGDGDKVISFHDTALSIPEEEKISEYYLLLRFFYT